ncbi:MAG: sigma-70 family RNA polymerase sigma factor [Bacteroidaceae bacterium]|nr:sigma-70 family RNA polymerase sigma factor [Bacteroidaceae bacterium]
MTATTFKEIFLPMSSAMYRTAYSILGNVQDAEDAVQEAFIRLWLARERIAADERLETYCITLTRNLCVDDLRRKREPTTGMRADELVVVDGHEPHTTMENMEAAGTVEAAINSLPEHQQQVARMSIIEERSAEEIEEATGFSAVNVRVLLSRAKKKLKKMIRL